MYKKQLKRIRRARQVVRRQQEELAAMALEGIVRVTLHTLTGSLTVTAGVGSQVADACREGLAEREKELAASARQLDLDWRESQEITARDAAFLRAAKRAQVYGDAPLPYPLGV